jgi:hypothetical protein
MSAMRELGGAQIVCRRLSGLAIGNNVERDLLSLIEAVHAGAFDCADMHEDIFAAVLGSNESETFLAVKPLDCSLHHGSFPCVCVKIKPRANAAGSFEILGEGRQSGALIAARPIRSAENSMPAYIEHYCTVRKTQVTQTQVTQTQVTQPQVTQPQVTQPQVTQPQVTQPQVTPNDLCELHSLESMIFLETRSLFSMARLYRAAIRRRCVEQKTGYLQVHAPC